MDIGPLEIGIIVLVIVVLFGAKKLPDLARSLGRSSNEFKKGLREGSAEEQSSADESPTPDPRTEPRPDAGTTASDDVPPTRAQDRPA
jgi:sec-independent protein translocase protein TatA